MTNKTPKLVRDLMTVGVVTCSPNTPVKVLARAVLEKGLEAVVVLDSEGHALGIVGQDQLVQAYVRGNYENMTAEDIMLDEVPQIPPDIPIIAAAQLMQDQGLRIVFLMHHAGGIEYPAALITYKHFLRHLGMNEAGEIDDLGIRAKRTAPLDAFIERRDSIKAQNKNMHID